MEVYTDGLCHTNEMGTMTTGSRAWFADGNPKNIAKRVPGPAQMNQAAEIHVVSVALNKIPPFVTAHIVTDLRYVMQGMTWDLYKWEDNGWLGVKNAPLTQDLTAQLQVRSVPTTFCWVKGHSRVEGNEKADALAQIGTEVHQPDQLLLPDACFLKNSVKMAALTQKLAYKGIRAAKTPDVRQVTARNVQRAMDEVKTHLAILIKESQIWKAVQHQDLNRRVQDFWWKLLHNMQQVGRFWMNIPGYKDRATCNFCGEMDSMEHILLDCQALG